MSFIEELARERDREKYTYIIIGIAPRGKKKMIKRIKRSTCTIRSTSLSALVGLVTCTQRFSLKKKKKKKNSCIERLHGSCEQKRDIQTKLDWIRIRLLP